MIFCRLLIFFNIHFFEKFFQAGISSECQMVWLQIRSDMLSGSVPNLGPNCLHRLSADNTNSKRLNGLLALHISHVNP